MKIFHSLVFSHLLKFSLDFSDINIAHFHRGGKQSTLQSTK